MGEVHPKSAQRYPRRIHAPRLARESYVGRQLAFLTICTATAADDLTVGSAAPNIIYVMGETAGRTGHLLEAWVVMPDHIHALARGLSESADAAEWVRRLKSRSGMAYKRRAGRGLWQRGFYDRMLRREDALPDVCRYIWNNPCRRALCAEWRAWPWSGGRMYERLLQEYREDEPGTPT